MFSLFVIFIIIKTINEYVNKEKNKIDSLKDLSVPNNNLLQNYSAIVFHFSMTIFIIVSFLMPAILSEETVYALIKDGFFQFFITLLIAIIGMINPFRAFSETFLKGIRENPKSAPIQNIVNWVYISQVWQIFKIILCVLITIHFFNTGYLILPSLNQGFVSGLVVFFIGIFVITSLIQLIKNPVIFKKQVLFRVNYLFNSIKKSFTISLFVVIVLFLISALSGGSSANKIPYETTALLVYNIVMTFNEYKILNLQRTNDVSLTP